MQRMFSALGRVIVKRILLVGLLGLLGLSGLFIFANQPALADKPLQLEEKFDSAYLLSEAPEVQEEQRQEAYEEAVEAVSDDPKQGLEEIYEEDLKDYREENPDKKGLVEGAKNLVDQVTGKD